MKDLRDLLQKFPIKKTPPPAAPLQFKPGRSLPIGHQYRGFCGKQHALRILKQRWKLVAKLTDDDSRAAIARLTKACDNEANPGYTLLHLANAALLAAEGTGVVWSIAMNSLLDKFEQRSNDEAENTEAAAERG